MHFDGGPDPLAGGQSRQHRACGMALLHRWHGHAAMAGAAGAHPPLGAKPNVFPSLWAGLLLLPELLHDAAAGASSCCTSLQAGAAGIEGVLPSPGSSPACPLEKGVEDVDKAAGGAGPEGNGCCSAPERQ